MLFSVIYSADCPRNESIARFRPPCARRLWDQTEGDHQYEYSYLEGEWDRGKHRKWCAMLDKYQLVATSAARHRALRSLPIVTHN